MCKGVNLYIFLVWLQILIFLYILPRVKFFEIFSEKYTKPIDILGVMGYNANIANAYQTHRH